MSMELHLLLSPLLEHSRNLSWSRLLWLFLIFPQAHHLPRKPSPFFPWGRDPRTPTFLGNISSLLFSSPLLLPSALHTPHFLSLLSPPYPASSLPLPFFFFLSSSLFFFPPFLPTFLFPSFPSVSSSLLLLFHFLYTAAEGKMLALLQ